jgi:hypothetical protein
MEDCGHDHSDEEITAYHKRAAEVVVASSSEERAALNERAKAIIEDAKKAWPSISDDDLASFFQSQAFLATGLSEMGVMKLATALDIMFSNCVLAASALKGAYDLEDIDAPKLDLDEMVAEAKTRYQESLDDADKNTGMFL